MGHSVGEYAAIASCGALSLLQAAQLLGVRARAMETVCTNTDGTMVALLKTTEEKAGEVARQAEEETGKVVDIANINSKDQA